MQILAHAASSVLLTLTHIVIGRVFTVNTEVRYLQMQMFDSLPDGLRQVVILFFTCSVRFVGILLVDMWTSVKHRRCTACHCGESQRHRAGTRCDDGE